MMNRAAVAAMTAVLTLFAGPAGPAQQPSAAGEKPPLVVRMGLDLVRVDAVVTDGKGRYVTDLTAKDFELRQDGKNREITHCEYVKLATPASAPPATGPIAGQPPLRAQSLRPGDVRRAMALIVDDLTLSFRGMYAVRRALDKMIDEQLGPGDLAAIVRTRGGTGMLQQFTSDKRLLHAAVQSLRYSPLFPALGENPGGGADSGAAEDAAGRGGSKSADEFESFRHRVLGTGTIGGIEFVLEGLQRLPGRKSVILFSERLPLLDRANADTTVMSRLQRLTDLANRASTVLYAVDPQGLASGISAESSGRVGDGAGARLMTGPQFAAGLQRAFANRIDAQTGLRELADRTGGLFFGEQNDVAAAVKRVIDDQQGYYLLGYTPDASTFEDLKRGSRFHSIKVSVKRAGLTARSRRGFLGVPDEERPLAAGPDPLASAMLSPFAATDLAVRLTSCFGYDPIRGYQVRFFLHVDATALGLPSQPPSDTYQAKLQMMATALGDNGISVDGGRRTVTIPVTAASFDRVRRMGTVLVLTLALQKPGLYQLRFALRNPATAQLGTASDLVSVPDLSAHRLALSGVMLGTLRPTPPPPGGATSDVEIGAPEDDPEVSPAVRRFRAGGDLLYVAAVYNPKLQGGEAHLDGRLKLVRADQSVVAAPQSAATLRRVDASPAASGRRPAPTQGQAKRVATFALFGRLRLPHDLAPGEYALQLEVTDQLEKGKHRSVSQWTTFDVVPPGETAALVSP